MTFERWHPIACRSSCPWPWPGPAWVIRDVPKVHFGQALRVETKEEMRTIIGSALDEEGRRKIVLFQAEKLQSPKVSEDERQRLHVSGPHVDPGPVFCIRCDAERQRLHACHGP